MVHLYDIVFVWIIFLMESREELENLWIALLISTFILAGLW